VFLLLVVAYSCASYCRNAYVFIKQSRFLCSSVRIAVSTFVYKGVFLGCGLFLSNTLFLPCILFCVYLVITRILYIFVFCHRSLFQDCVFSVERHISEHRGEVRFNKDFLLCFFFTLQCRTVVITSSYTTSIFKIYHKILML